jgi:hypothetical protein
MSASPRSYSQSEKLTRGTRFLNNELARLQTRIFCARNDALVIPSEARNLTIEAKITQTDHRDQSACGGCWAVSK